ncbi:MAG: ABC transporter permease [Eubacteriales bacterium]
MKLTSLAFSNIKHNMKNYTMYFFAMCFCVFTTYSFANLALSETVFLHIQGSMKYQNMFVGFGIAILVFVVFFLISSNNSFIRYRKKEISTYALFGMENKKIGQLLFFETIFIGAIALVIGIALGIFFSKLMVMVLLKMMLSEYAHVNFGIGIDALIVTISIYIAIFCLMGLSGLRTINKFQLVDLFKGDRVSEKRTTGSYFLLILSIALISAGYSIAISDDGYKVAVNMITVIVIVVLGSYLFFVGGLQKLLYLIKKNKSFLYKKSRVVSISLLSHKARTLATTMGTIAVLVATSVTAMAFGYTLYQSAENNSNELNSFDIWYYADNPNVEKQIYEAIESNGSKPVSAVKFQRYLTSADAENLPDAAIFYTENKLQLMAYSQSTFNEIVNVAKDSNENITVNQGEAVLVYPNYVTALETNDALLIYDEIQYDIKLMQMPNPYTYGGQLTVVFADDDFAKLLDKGYISDNDGQMWPFVGINYKNAITSRNLAKDLNIIMHNSENVGMYRLLYNSYIESMEVFGLICFIGYFICAVFVLMSVSLLYFKQIAIGTEESNQYEKLRKIGMDKEQEAVVIKNRIAPVFFVPLVMGLIHSVFAMKGADTIIFSNMIYVSGSTFLQVLKISSVMYAIYFIIYLGFYFITKYKYMRVISNK